MTWEISIPSKFCKTQPHSLSWTNVYFGINLALNFIFFLWLLCYPDLFSWVLNQFRLIFIFLKNIINFIQGSCWYSHFFLCIPPCFPALLWCGFFLDLQFPEFHLRMLDNPFCTGVLTNNKQLIQISSHIP